MVPPSSGRLTPSGGPSHSRRTSLASTAPHSNGNTTSVKVGSDGARVATRFQRTVVHALNATTLQLESAPPGGSASASAASALAKAGSAKTTFTFDRVISPDEGQPAVYACAESLVESFLTGMNVTILAYGQTSSGKSYTMGTDRTSDADDALGEDRLGITPRAVAQIFDRMREITKEARGGTTFSAKLSYVEIYNEDLIDLLAGDADVRPTVQIREDKQGKIIWSGLREVKVTSALEVMTHLTAGSALRQTNATDMNAQSSRSHAIFSLTLTQRKYSGAGVPPTPPSPPTSRISSRASVMPRVSSPVPGSSSRSATPTNDRPGSRFGLRPPSALGNPRASSPLPDEPTHSAGNGASGGDSDSWTAISSKFHFVDLAGSERLKRTAASGDRVKEGISINSGLHALGNVISALGDPAKKSTHVPYRDSKLTRLLQDSLGGNAQTMMVACVSPTEFNLNETISTVKYANRARNIKNRAEINEIEVGWDDVDYLQRTLTKLRGEMALLKSGEVSPIIPTLSEEDSSMVRGRARQALAPEMQELQDKYSDLSQRYAQLTAELATIKSARPELAAGSLTRDEFAKAVEPIVEEYERSLSAIESQLALTKAALGHSEDEMRELEARVEAELQANQMQVGVIDELKARVVKLSEREATVEAYVRDLEAKLKDSGEQDASHGSTVSDLRKELARNREQGATQEQYIRELETRLAKADDSEATLRGQIEVLERDIGRREAAYQELEARLSLLDTTQEHKLLLAELDEKDRRVLELERGLDELKMQRAEAESEAQRLGKLAAAEKEVKDELQSRVRTLERASIVLASSSAQATSSEHFPVPGDALDRQHIDHASQSGEPSTVTATALPVPAETVLVATLEARLAALHDTHDETLAELDSANVRYRNAVKEIEDLNAQVQDIRFARSAEGDSQTSSVPPSPNLARQSFGNIGDEYEELAASKFVPTGTTSPSPTQTRTPRPRRSMPLAPQHRLSFLGRGQGAASPTATHLRSASLSQELSSAVSSQVSLPPSPRPPSPSDRRSPFSASRDSIYANFFGSTIGSSPSAHNERSYEQIKNEVMKLQLALQERDTEIAALEASVLLLRGGAQTTAGESPVIPPAFGSPPRAVPTTANDGGHSPDIHGVREAPKSTGALSSGDGDAATRLDDLMRAMAKKESTHRETVEQLQEQLTTLRRQHEELTVLSRDQVVNMSSEISRLRRDLSERPSPSHCDAEIAELRSKLGRGIDDAAASKKEAESALENAMASSNQVLDALAAEHTQAVQQLQDEHAQSLEAALAKRDEPLRRMEAERATALESLGRAHDEALKRHTLDHTAAMKAQSDEMDQALRRKADELEEASRRFEIERAGLADKEEDTSARLVERLNAEHSAVLQRREDDFTAVVGNLKADHARALSDRDLSYAEAMDQLRNQRDGDLAKLAAEHLAAAAHQREEFEIRTKQAQADHSKALQARSDSHDSLFAKLEEDHVTRLADAAQQHSSVIASREEAHTLELAHERKVHADAIIGLKESHAQELKAAQETVSKRLAEGLDELRKQHSQGVTALKAAHERELTTVASEHAAAIAAQRTSHAERVRETEVDRDEARAAHLELGALHAQLGSEHHDTQMALATSASDHKTTIRALDELRAQMASAGAALSVPHSVESNATDATIATGNELEKARLLVNRLEVELSDVRRERDHVSEQLQQLAHANGTSPSSPDLSHESFSRAMTPDRTMSPTGDPGHSSPQGRPDLRVGIINGFATGSKPPPPTPPPSMPPPPLPMNPPTISSTGSTRATTRTSSSSSIGRISIGANDSTPGTSTRSDSTTIDLRLIKRVDEQEAQIARLTKQLTHCEADLQANIDLVNTLESALNDSERNLRKARVQMNDLARERDSYMGQNEALRRELQDSHTENETVRHSVLEVESQLQAERYNRDRAKQDLERRLEDVNRKGKSKYACF